MRCYEKNIAELRGMHKLGQIELNPPYQRKPAWKINQRRLLLSSLFNGIPIPALIFHKHFRKGELKDVYDVLDGKQRLETILHFIKEQKLKNVETLSVKLKNRENNKEYTLTYNDLVNKKKKEDYSNILEKFFQYPIPIIEYEGELTDIFGNNVATKEVFVRINSTGSPLKKHEIRHARCSGPFFKLGDKLEKKYKALFENNWKIVSKGDVDRYILHEYILELCTACFSDDYTNRRDKLDELLSDHKWTKKDIKRVEESFNKVISWIKRIFPNDGIKYTRFKNKSDFYSLFTVLHKLGQKGYVTKDNKSNKIAGKFLMMFSKQIQTLDLKHHGKSITDVKLSDYEKQLASYLNATMQATDIRKNREIRDKWLMATLKDGFFLKPKDSKRNFDNTVKDILWLELMLKDKKPKCPNHKKNSKCHKDLKYKEAQVDHIYPWSKGGPTKIGNAQLLCSNCNISKGGK